MAQAEAALDGLKAGATTEQIAAAQAQVDVAQAALEAAQTQLNKTIITAPVNGLIAATSVHTGELAAPSAHRVETGRSRSGALDDLRAGRRTRPILDRSADQRAGGCISRSGIPRHDRFDQRQAEYTPRNVRTPNERMKLVYAVKIKIDNPDHVLKPGLQAEAEVE